MQQSVMRARFFLFLGILFIVWGIGPFIWPLVKIVFGVWLVIYSMSLRGQSSIFPQGFFYGMNRSIRIFLNSHR